MAVIMAMMLKTEASFCYCLPPLIICNLLLSLGQWQPYSLWKATVGSADIDATFCILRGLRYPSCKLQEEGINKFVCHMTGRRTRYWSSEQPGGEFWRDLIEDKAPMKQVRKW